MWQASKLYKTVFLILILVTLNLVILVNNFDYFIGDITISQSIQSVFHSDLAWADMLSNLAKSPYSIILLLVTMTLAFAIKGIRSLVLSIISFVGLSLLDKIIKFFVFQARPSTELIFVSENSTSSAFPSTSAIIYVATFGFLLLLSAKFYKESLLNKLVFFISLIPLVAIFFARVALGAHWPSDLIITYIVGIVWIMLLLPFLPKR